MFQSVKTKKLLDITQEEADRLKGLGILTVEVEVSQTVEKEGDIPPKVQVRAKKPKTIEEVVPEPQNNEVVQ